MKITAARDYNGYMTGKRTIDEQETNIIHEGASEEMWTRGNQIECDT